MPPHPHNIILFKLNLNIKFPLLRLLKFISDSKRTSLIHLEIQNKMILAATTP